MQQVPRLPRRRNKNKAKKPLNDPQVDKPSASQVGRQNASQASRPKDPPEEMDIGQVSENGVGEFLPLAVSVAGILVWVFAATPKGELVHLFWVGYLLHYSYLLLAVGLLFPMSKTWLGGLYWPLWGVVSILIIAASNYLDNIAWGLMAVGASCFCKTRSGRGDVSTALAIAAVCGIGLQMTVCFTYYLASDAFWMDLTAYTNKSPFVVLDYLLCSLALVFFFWAQRAHLTRIELCGLITLTACFCGDLALTAFCFLVPFKQAMSTFKWTARSLPEMLTIVAFLAIFFYIRLPFFVPEPELNVISTGFEYVIGGRIFGATILIGLTLFAYKEIDISIQLSGTPDPGLSEFATRLYQIWCMSLISHVLFPFPMFITMGIGKSVVDFQFTSKSKLFRFCCDVMLMAVAFQAEPLALAWATAFLILIEKNDQLSFLVSVPCMASVLAPDNYWLFSAFLLLLIQLPEPTCLFSDCCPRDRILQFFDRVQSFLQPYEPPQALTLIVVKTFPNPSCFILPFCRTEGQRLAAKNHVGLLALSLSSRAMQSPECSALV